MIDGGVRASVPGTEFPGQELAGVVTPHPDGMEPERAFERRSGLFLLRMGDHDRGIHIQHDNLSQTGVSDPNGPARLRESGPTHVDEPSPGQSGSSASEPG